MLGVGREPILKNSICTRQIVPFWRFGLYLFDISSTSSPFCKLQRDCAYIQYEIRYDIFDMVIGGIILGIGIDMMGT
jgi:hypothetical protein